MTRPTSPRNGYALLAVLWISMGVSALLFAVSVEARQAIGTARNRIALTEATWSAAGCFAYARAAVTDSLLAAERTGSVAVTKAWNVVDHLLSNVSVPSFFQCHVAARALGSGFDVNRGSEAAVAQFLRQALGLAPWDADSASAALADWKDPDHEVRPGGAERGWYRDQHRPRPSNRPIRSVEELRLVRGFRSLGGLDTLIEVEPAPASLYHAHPAVLSRLPGISTEAADLLRIARQRRTPFGGFTELSGALSALDREEFERMIPALVPTAGFEPLAWIVTVRGWAGQPAIAAVVEAKMGRSGATPTVLRWRTRTE